MTPGAKSNLIRKKILVLYVGGTIGMKKDKNGIYIPCPNQFLEKLKFYSQMHDPESAKKYFDHIEPNELVLPPTGKAVVLYQIEEYTPLLDSSNMSTPDWIRIAKDVEANYDKFSGFVILHGTDTLAYTSSALSFMLEGLQKPVILTGSQIPIFETRSDAKDNILASLILASYDIPEVCVFFSHKLLRGNRTAKISTTHLNAFDSPNYHHLAEVGIDIRVYKHYIRKAAHESFKVNTNLNPNVALLTLYPTITISTLEAFMQPPIEGVVIQSFGSGNIPMHNKDLLKVLKDAVARGVVIVNVTQCAQGSVSISYAGGKALEETGVISGYDMTAEAAVAKMCHILGIPKLTYSEKIKMVEEDIRGELTNDY